MPRCRHALHVIFCYTYFASSARNQKRRERRLQLCGARERQRELAAPPCGPSCRPLHRGRSRFCCGKSGIFHKRIEVVALPTRIHLIKKLQCHHPAAWTRLTDERRHVQRIQLRTIKPRVHNDLERSLRQDLSMAEVLQQELHNCWSMRLHLQERPCVFGLRDPQPLTQLGQLLRPQRQFPRAHKGVPTGTARPCPGGFLSRKPAGSIL